METWSLTNNPIVNSGRFFKRFRQIVFYEKIVIIILRFLAVVYPVSSLPYRTPSMTKMAILLTWTVILLSNSPVWVAHVTMEITNGFIGLFICIINQKSPGREVNMEKVNFELVLHHLFLIFRVL